MDLEEYLETNGLTAASFARLHHISYPTLYKVLCGRMPRLDFAMHIERATKKRVRLEDLLKPKKQGGKYPGKSRTYHKTDNKKPSKTSIVFDAIQDLAEHLFHTDTVPDHKDHV